MAHSHQQTLLAKLGFSDPDHKDPRHTLACEYLCKPEVLQKMGQVLFEVAPTPVERPDKIVLAPGANLPTGTLKATDSWIESRSAKTEVPVMNHTYNSKYYVGFVDVSVSFSIRKWCLQGGVPVKKEVHQYITCTNECPWCQIGTSSPSEHLIGGQYIDCENECDGCDRCTHEWSKYFPNEHGPNHMLQHKVRESDIVVVGTSYEYLYQQDKVEAIVEVKVTKCDPADIVKQLKLYQQYMPYRMVVATCYPVSQSTKDMFAREGIKHIFLGAGFEAYCAARRAEKPVTEEGL